ncbi:MAG TPA: biotin/lipoyl-containing protein, partial [Thermoleophilaceae bacterium]|nr:biotin/lipoyl-containing protein [Thermoleophilaceae bacterium]
MAAPGTTVQITMPAMGESVTEGVVLEWLKQVGDRVEVDEGLVEISTDKVDAEVPSPAAGVLTAINVQPDETVTVGTVLGEIEVGEGGAVPKAPVDDPVDDDGAAAPPSDNGSAAPRAAADADATPVAARMAADLGVDVSGVAGSGPRGRVTKDDVLAAVASAVKGNGGPAAPSAPAPPDGAAAKQIRGPAATLVRFMEDSRSIPTATSFRTLAVDTLAARRATLKGAGKKLSFTHLIAWAIVRATDDMPVMADSFAAVDGKPHRVSPEAVSLGLAVDVERKDGTRSLVVPVIHEASKLSFGDFVAAYD